MITFTNNTTSLACRYREWPSIELDLKTTFKRNMSRDLRAFVKRPACKRYFLELVFLSVARRDDFVAFYKATAGGFFIYRDFENISTQVRFIEVSEFSFNGRNEYSVNVTLEATNV